MGQTQQEKEQPQTQAASPLSCQNCACFPVCTVYRAIEPMIKQAFTENIKPFEAQDLAKICALFFSKSLAKIIKETESSAAQA
jgi:hypothetical protein